MVGRFGPRFGLEAAFLIAVAVILGLLEVTWPAIVAAMAIAWLLVAAFEVALSRQRPSPEAVAEPTPVTEESEGFRIVAQGEEEELFVAPAVEAAAPPEEAELSPAAAAAQELVEAEEPMAVTPAAEVPPEGAEEEAAEAVPELVPAAAAEELPPPPPPPVLEPVPSVPAPVAAVPEPEPEPEAELEPEPQVVELHPEAPREWNLWELERLARDHAGDDPIRDEEWSFLLIYLREFASPDGHLPRDFDGLVRESFGDILRTPR